MRRLRGATGSMPLHAGAAIDALSDAWKSPWLRKIEKVKSAAVPTVV
jgi:hypothetical protein